MSQLYSFIPSKDDSQLPLYSTYKFVGYSINPSDTTTITEEVPAIISKDIDIYAIFEIVNVYDNILSSDYFTVYESGNEVILRLTNKSLSGKITIPAVVDGKHITSFND